MSYCTQCGNVLGSTNRFCSRCGQGTSGVSFSSASYLLGDYAESKSKVEKRKCPKCEGSGEMELSEWGFPSMLLNIATLGLADHITNGITCDWCDGEGEVEA